MQLVAAMHGPVLAQSAATVHVAPRQLIEMSSSPRSCEPFTSSGPSVDELQENRDTVEIKSIKENTFRIIFSANQQLSNIV